MTSEMQALVAAVKRHAYAHYEQRGWDVLVECHTDEEIAGWIGNAKTEAGAIRNVAKNSGIREYDSRRRDIQGEIF